MLRISRLNTLYIIMRIVIIAWLLGVSLCCSVNGAQVTVVPPGSSWRVFLGTQEASSPDTAWRAVGFDDASWSTGVAPVGYPTPNPPERVGHENSIATVIPSSGVGNYVSVYFRKTFQLTNVADLTSLNLQVFADDGAVAYINGVEAGRINLPAGSLAYNCCATGILDEEEQVLNASVQNSGHLVVGENVLAIHVFNVNAASSDLHVEASLTAVLDIEPPIVLQTFPVPGSTNRALTSVEVFFSEAVTGVDAADLLINDVPATSITFGLPGQFRFDFPQPATGTVSVAWAPGHGIVDLATPPRPFAGGSWTYVLDPNLPLTALLLNEFMADNDGTLNDEDGESSDWIELHNPGSVQADIGGWFLTDDASRLTQWQFPPGQTIPAGGYLVVFASNKNKTNVAGRLHTNFQLANEGEYLALVDRDTNVVSHFPPPFAAQSVDISYGRVANDPTRTGYFTTPTPGTRNQSAGAGFAPEVTFSRPSGTFVATAPFALTLSTPVANAVIHYAFGTNVPGTNSAMYSAPMQINNTTMIRARAFAPGLLPGPITTKSYIQLANVTNVVNFNSHLPIMILHNYGQGALLTDKSERYVIAQTFEPIFGRSSMTDEPVHSEFGIFHLRGSSTVGYAKGSFFLEVQDEFRNDKEVNLLGLPQESDWVLYAPNNFEPALFHNPLAFQLARDLGEYASRTRFVEVYLKDDAGAPGPMTAADYNGVYVLQEKIKRDNNRVDIAPIEREHVTEPAITGGYIFSIDRQGSGNEPQLSAGGGTINWADPNGFEMTNAARVPQLNYVRNYFNTFRDVLNNNATWTNPVTGYGAYIDVDSWARRHVHEVVTHNIDSLRLSGYFYKDRGKKIEYGPAWDYDRTQGSTDSRDFNPRVFRSRISDFGTDYFNFAPWWNRLFTDPDFWQRWIDHYQKYREGPLSLTNIAARIESLAAEIRPAHRRETNRWNIRPRTGTLNPDGQFAYNFGPTSDYENEVRWKVVWYSNRLDFIDTNLLDRPRLSRPAGAVTNDYRVTLSPAAKPGSSLFYTLDGTDPRLPSGGFLPTAFSNNGPVELIITNNVRLFARSWNPGHSNVIGANNPPISSPWSGARDETLYTHVPALRITEIMYHAQNALPNYTNDVNFEYLEVKNVGSTPLNLNRFSISGGIDFQFPNVTLDPGQAGVIVANQGQFIARYGPGKLILGQYAGDYFGDKTNVLDNAGERLVLRGAAREPILDFEYDDDWYTLTDGFGFSLVIVDENAATDTWGLKTSWRASGVVDGSPAANDPPQPVFPLVVINEVLTHTDPAPPYDSIELVNLSTNVADIGGWFLTDDFTEPRKYRIPDGYTIPPGGFAVFDETHFNAGAQPFSLSSLGEEVYLFSGDFNENLSGYFQGFDFGPAENGRSFGRHIISTGTDQFPPQVRTTLGATNAGPLIGPIIVSEIHYHPWDIRAGAGFRDNDADEYIELQNITATNVPLYHPAYPMNTWHLNNAVDYDFPPGVVLPPGGYLLVVNFNPANSAEAAAFRARNYVPAHVPLFGPYSGKLDNSGEALELRRPDRPEPLGPPSFGLAPSLLVERINYSDTAPWPTNADGRGLTLQRAAGNTYGNDPASWAAAVGSPGSAFVGGPPPEITAQPADTSAYFSYDATFSVQASGANLRYQWLFNGGPIAGGTNTTLVVRYVVPGSAGEYSVAVLGSGGVVVSSNAVLTVLMTSATIVAHPPTMSVVLGANFTNTISVSGAGPFTYQWFFNGEEIPGATTNSLPIAPVQLSSAGSYHVRITDPITSIFTRPGTLTVLVPPLIVQQPLSQFVPFGGSATLSVVVTNNATLPVTNRWRRISGTSGGPVTNTVFGVVDFYTVTNVTGSNRYDVILSNPGRALGLQSATAFVAPIPDGDHDGMPDSWESQYGFDSGDPLDAAADFDGDTMTNLAEYIAGTDPTDNQSYLYVELLDASARLQFMAVSNKTYTLQVRESLTAGNWSVLRHLNAAATNRLLEVLDPGPGASSRFYQLITPKQ